MVRLYKGEKNYSYHNRGILTVGLVRLGQVRLGLVGIGDVRKRLPCSNRNSF
jgi:hypothetical protein